MPKHPGNSIGLPPTLPRGRDAMNHLSGPGLGLRLTQQRHDSSQTREQLPSIHSNYLKHISSIVPKRPRARVGASIQGGSRPRRLW